MTRPPAEKVKAPGVHAAAGCSPFKVPEPVDRSGTTCPIPYRETGEMGVDPTGGQSTTLHTHTSPQEPRFTSDVKVILLNGHCVQEVGRGGPERKISTCSGTMDGSATAPVRLGRRVKVPAPPPLPEQQNSKSRRKDTAMAQKQGMPQVMALLQAKSGFLL